MTYPVKGCLKLEGQPPVETFEIKKVYFNEISIRLFPMIISDNPAVSSGAPVQIGWKPFDESIVDVDVFEYTRSKERQRSKKRMLLSVRRRANVLMEAGYSLEDIASATMDAEKTKRNRAESLKQSGWNNPWELLSGAVETSGKALKKVGAVGAGVGSGAGRAVGSFGKASISNVTGATKATGRVLVSGVNTSSRAVTSGVSKGAKLVATPVVAVARPVGKVGRALASAVGITIKSKDDGMGDKATKPKGRSSMPRRSSLGDLSSGSWRKNGPGSPSA